MYGRILKSLNIVNLYLGMPKLKLKINVNLPQLLRIVVSVALNREFERFGGFWCYLYSGTNESNSRVTKPMTTKSCKHFSTFPATRVRSKYI